MGMAYAQAGRFADAIHAAGRAQWIARSAGDKAWVNSIEQRVKLYEQNVPFRNQHSPSHSTDP